MVHKANSIEIVLNNSKIIIMYADYLDKYLLNTH